MDTASRVFRTIINGETVYENRNYVGVHLAKHHPANKSKIMMMNYILDTVYPMYGAITDVQVWDKVLEEDEVTSWRECRAGTFVGSSGA